MSILAGFAKGATGYALDRMEKREDAELEMKKAQMLEQLRKETAKDLAEFEENLPSAKLRRAQTEQNMEMDRKKEARDAEGWELEKGYTAIDYEQKANKEVREQEMHALEKQQALESIANARTSRRLSLDSAARQRRQDRQEEADNGKNILFAEYDRTIKELQDAGANPSVIANFQTMWNEGVNMKRWGKDQQRVFLQRTRESFTQGWTDNKGRRQKPLLQSFGSNTDPVLESRLKDE